MVECLWWLDGVVFEALRLGVGIGIENWFINRSATRPETATTHFVRVGFNHHITSAVWYAWVLRCRTSGEADEHIRDHRPHVSDPSQRGFDPALRLAWSRWLQASQATPGLTWFLDKSQLLSVVGERLSW